MITKSGDKEVRKKVLQVIEEVNSSKHTNYVLGNYIGEGGFTYTYELINYEKEGNFVIKVTPWKGYDTDTWRDIVERKRSEVALLADANELYVSRIYDKYECFGSNDLPECILTVEKRLEPYDRYFKDAGEKIPVSSDHTATKLMKELSQSLGYIHKDLHTMHRDIKADNFAYDPVTKRLVFIDFSISKGKCTDVETITTAPAASYLFSAPEYVFSLRSGYDQKKEEHYTCEMDMYSLGAVMFYFVTGKYTVERVNGAYIERSPQNKQTLLRQSGISPLVQTIILTLIDENPEDRYHTADELLDVVKDLYDLTESNETLKARSDKLKDEEVRAKRRVEALESEHAQLNDQLNRQNRQIEKLKDIRKGKSTSSGLIWFVAPLAGLFCLYVVMSMLVTPLPGYKYIAQFFVTWESQYAVWICMWVSLLLTVVQIGFISGRGNFIAFLIAVTITVLGCLYPTLLSGVGMIDRYEFVGDLFVKDGYTIKPAVTPTLFEHAAHKTDYESEDYTIKNDTIHVKKSARGKAFPFGVVCFTNRNGQWTSGAFIVDNTYNVTPDKISVDGNSIEVKITDVKRSSSTTAIMCKVGATGMSFRKKQKVYVEVYVVLQNGARIFISTEKVHTNRKGAFVVGFDREMHNVEFLEMNITCDTFAKFQTVDVWAEAVSK